MAYRAFAGTASRRLVVGGVSAGLFGYAIQGPLTRMDDGGLVLTPAEQQFTTSSQYPVPAGYSGPTFKIRVDYPSLTPASTTPKTTNILPPLPGPERPIPADPEADAPWLKIDFQKDPEAYSNMVKEYCWTGNVNNEFDVWKNSVRNWYHAPWMHYSNNGREPIHGLTFERPTPKLELSKTQNRVLQTWACGFYNSAGAAVFGKAWTNPNSPEWKENLQFPKGTAVFKILMTDATNEEVPTMTGAPSMKAVIADASKGLKNAASRNNFASDLRLLQVDWAVRDDRAPIGWVFGTYMYDSSVKNSDPWERITPVGLMWGNDPTLTDALADSGKKPVESWINPKAEQIRLSLGGSRPSWGWKGRMNGPADNFKSACASCHSTAERSLKDDTHTPMIPVAGKNDMLWFRNIPAGQPWTDDKQHVSSDYSLQFMMGYYNYLQWREDQKPKMLQLWDRTKYIVPFSETRKRMDTIEAKRDLLRNGEDLEYDENGPIERS